MSLPGRLLSHIQFLKNPIFDRTTPLTTRTNLRKLHFHNNPKFWQHYFNASARRSFFSKIYFTLSNFPKYHSSIWARLDSYYCIINVHKSPRFVLFFSIRTFLCAVSYSFKFDENLPGTQIILFMQSE